MKKLTYLWTLLILAALVITLIFVIPFERSNPKSVSSVEWQLHLGTMFRDIGYGLSILDESRVLVAGWTTKENSEFTDDQDVYLAEISSSGELLWERRLGGSKSDGASGICSTKDGGIIVVGSTWSTDGDVTNNHGQQDVWVLKFNKNRDLEWEKTFGGSDVETAFDIQQVSDGGYIFVGYTKSQDGDISENHGQEDIWIVKLSESGEIEWERTFGGSSWDNAYSVCETHDKGYIVVGFTFSDDGDVKEKHESADYWVLRLNNNGEMLWQKCLGGNNWDQAFSVVETDDKGFAILGTTWSDNVDESRGAGDYWLVKLSETGEIKWSKRFGGSNDDIGTEILQTEDKGFIICGATWSYDGDVNGKHGGSDYWVVKTDSQGNLQWQTCLGDDMDEIAYAIQKIKSTEYVVSGISYSPVMGIKARSHGGGDVWVVKLR